MKNLPTILEKGRLFSFYALALALPVAETPMHVAFILFWVCSLGSPVFWRRRVTLVDVILLGMAFTAMLSTMVNWPLVNGIKGLRNNFTLCSLFLACYRSHFKSHELRIFAGCLVVGAMVGLLWGGVDWLRGMTPAGLELHSAGVVTQSAIYLGMMCCVMLGIALDATGVFSRNDKAINALCLAVSLIGFLVMGSRGALLASLGIIAVLVKTYWQLKKIRYATLAGAACGVFLIGLSVVISVPPPEKLQRMPAPKRIFLAAIDRVHHLLGQSTVDAQLDSNMVRYENWRIALAQVTKGGHPFIGVGPRNYESIKVEALQITPPLKTYPKVWQHLQHAHNLFLTKACEEGWLGLAVFVAFFLVCGHGLFVLGGTYRHQWWWLAGVGGLVFPVVAGSFNSPFYNEFAWLSMVLLGIAMGVIASPAGGVASEH